MLHEISPSIPSKVHVITKLILDMTNQKHEWQNVRVKNSVCPNSSTQTTKFYQWCMNFQEGSWPYRCTHAFKNDWEKLSLYFLSWRICIGTIIIWFRVQFGINKHKYIFQRLTKLLEAIGWVQFEVFEKFTSAYLFQIAQEKSCDYLLIIYMKKSQDG